MLIRGSTFPTIGTFAFIRVIASHFVRCHRFAPASAFLVRALHYGGQVGGLGENL